VPRGVDPAEAMRLLQENIPGENFQLNRLYRLYQPAMKENKESREAHLGSPAVAGEKKCAGDRCYAQSTIQWKDQLAPCSRNVKIGVIDTGYDLRHPAFKSQKILSKAFMPEGRNPAANWHGTGVLALLAGRSDSGTPGLAPAASYHAASIFYADEDGGTVTDTVSFLKALDWMGNSGVRIVNMSFAGPRDDLVESKIASLSARGMVFTAAAGNEGPTAAPAYPAAYPQVIAVTAVTKDLRNYPYANRGDHIDLAAPGTDIWTAWPDAKEGYRSGTSFAAPFVTGVLAVYPPDVLREPKESLLERVNVTDLGATGRDPIYGRGLLRAPATCQGSASEVAELGNSTGRD
jgi:subtilisin family serine protease